MRDTFLDELLIFIFLLFAKIVDISFRKRRIFCTGYLSENLFRENFVKSFENVSVISNKEQRLTCDNFK